MEKIVTLFLSSLVDIQAMIRTMMEFEHISFDEAVERLSK
jgi:hypothetical protein